MPKNLQIQDDRELVRRVRDGDKQAFEQLYRAYFRNLCEFAYRYVRIPAVCEEIVQELFLNLWRKRDTLDPDGRCRAYLYKSVRNGALDYLKHLEVQREYLNHLALENRMEWESVSMESADLEEKDQLQMLNRAIREAIDQLPEQRRMIFLLSREDGLTYQEIADVLNISVKTVETQMGRSLGTLRKLLAGYLSSLLLVGGALHHLL